MKRTVIARDDVFVTVTASKPRPEKFDSKKVVPGLGGVQRAMPALVPLANDETTGSLEVSRTVA
jgi:hypothetical protein